MPFLIVREDITKMKVDAIVNAANTSLLGGGGVDGAIHKAAGPFLLRECRRLGGCDVGDAKITGSGNLPCKYVIHTVGPVWHGGQRGEGELLESCYEKSLELAVENQCESVAFSFISTGAYGYPKDEALRIATSTIQDFLNKTEADDITVYLVIFDKKSLVIAKDVFEDISELISDEEVENLEKIHRRRSQPLMLEKPPKEHKSPPKSKSYKANDIEILPLKDRLEDKPTVPAEPMTCKKGAKAAHETSDDSALQNELEQIDESFAQMLLRKIDEKEMSDAQCYKRANIDRKLFSKIRSNPNYKPSKTTAIAFAIALELSLDETNEMLIKAGYALSPSQKFDIIVKYFIDRKKYNIFEINEALFAFDQRLLGS